MKKSTKEENTSKESMVSRLVSMQLNYNMLLSRLNQVLEQQVKENKQKKFNNNKNQ